MYDLIIVGGGPSGASAGRVAGKAGVRTLLLEKEHFPRYKPCGGGLSLHALSYLDFELPASMIERDISRVKINFKGQSVEVQKGDQLAVLVSRGVFDNFLLEKARETGIEVHHSGRVYTTGYPLEKARETGIEVHCGEKVLGCKERDKCVEVTTSDNSYLARFVLIAEGSQGMLKYAVREQKDRRDEFDLGMVVEIPETDAVIRNHLPGMLDIYFGIARGGYGWVFSHSGYYSVGIVGAAKYLENPKQLMRDFLQANGFSGECAINSHIIPAGGYKRKIMSSRLLLSGDAAGFVDAFTGEGMAYAIRSGQLAAEIVSDLVLYDRKLSCLKSYEAKCKQEFEDHLTHSLKLEKIMHRFPEKTFRLAASNKELLDRCLDVAFLGKSYTGYVRWLLLNFKFG